MLKLNMCLLSFRNSLKITSNSIWAYISHFFRSQPPANPRVNANNSLLIEKQSITLEQTNIDVENPYGFPRTRIRKWYQMVGVNL
jgi:hypothetical protein